MKLYKTVLILSSVPIILYSILGNIYFFLFTYDELKNVIDTEYNGLLDIIGYEYDAKNKNSVFFVEDKDGLTGDYVYDSKTNSFSDGYKSISSRIAYYTVRGNIIKKIITSGIIPEDIDVIYKIKAGIASDIKTGEAQIDEIIVTVDDDLNKNEFCEDIILIEESLKEVKNSKITVKSENYVYHIVEGFLSADKRDILAGITDLRG